MKQEERQVYKNNWNKNNNKGKKKIKILPQLGH